MKTTNPTEEWWANLPGGEKDFIRALIGMIKGAKHSHVPEVAKAAQKWESGISCFIKVRLKNDGRKKRSRAARALATSHRAIAPAALN